MRIIPAIDIIEGECVRLSKGAYDSKTVYSSNPLEVASMFEDKGFKWLHLVDLDGAKLGKPMNLAVLEQIAAKTSLEVDYGGGLRSEPSVASAFDAGAKAITAGSVAAQNPALVCSWIDRWGSDRIIIGADVLNGFIATEGWQSIERIGIQEYVASYLNKGATRFICTDVSRDGMLSGSALELYRQLLVKFGDIDLVASGGVTSIEEIRELNRMGLWGAIVGKAIYEGRIDIDELAKEV